METNPMNHPEPKSKDSHYTVLFGRSVWGIVLNIIAILLLILLIVAAVVPFGGGFKAINNGILFAKIFVAVLSIAICAILRVLALVLDKLNEQGKI